MPGPDFGESREPSPPAHRHEERTAAPPDSELAIALPEWNLLPPAEFLQRHSRRR
ncbi:hypothetical protein [Umezawaea sp. NPDC059074]|uniref:hypothetical protein n=1 Tax=Umezawaea sp. NPDC059074 TaxID=3346716 RepID=UPI0036A19399